LPTHCKIFRPVQKVGPVGNIVISQIKLYISLLLLKEGKGEGKGKSNKLHFPLAFFQFAAPTLGLTEKAFRLFKSEWHLMSQGQFFGQVAQKLDAVRNIRTLLDAAYIKSKVM
jgi:hypothetical protein